MRFSTLFVSSVMAILSVSAQTGEGSTSSEAHASITSVVAAQTTLPVTSSDGSRDHTEDSTSTTIALVSGTESATPAQQSATDCLATCSSDDSNCRAKCLLLAQGVNPIALCQAECPKGNGTDIDNNNYKICYQGCISTATLITATAAAAAATNSDGSVNTDTTSPAGTDTGAAAVATSTGSAKASSTNAAPAGIPTGLTVAGVAGILAAMLAL